MERGSETYIQKKPTCTDRNPSLPGLYDNRDEVEQPQDTGTRQAL